MIYVQGTVQDGLIRLPEVIRIPDGVRVIITILEQKVKNTKGVLSQEIEEEDLEFVRACRGRLAKQLHDEDQ